MKKINKILALMLILTLVFALTACASDSVVGTWKCTVDYDKVLAEMETDGGDSSMLETMKNAFAGLKLALILDLKEDNTFKLATDEDNAKEVAAVLEERLPDLMSNMLAALSGMTREEYEAYLASVGMTMDDALAMVGDTFSADGLVESMAVEGVEGTYTYENGKLTLTGDDGVVVYTVTLKGNELQITDIDSGEDALPEGLLPLVFVK